MATSHNFMSRMLGHPAPVFSAAAVFLLIETPALAAAGEKAPSAAIFLAELVVLMVAGRLLGEAMQRIGQPAVMGQLLAGLMLEPSVFSVL